MKKLNTSLKFKFFIFNLIIIFSVLLVSTGTAMFIFKNKIGEIAENVATESEKVLDSRLEKSSEIGTKFLDIVVKNMEKDAILLGRNDRLFYMITEGMTPRGKIVKKDNSYFLRYRKMKNNLPYYKVLNDLHKKTYGTGDSLEQMELVDSKGIIVARTFIDDKEYMEKDNSKIIRMMLDENLEVYHNIIKGRNGIYLKVYGALRDEFETKGVVIVSMPLNNYFLNSLKELTGVEVALYRGSKFSNGTFFSYGEETSLLKLKDEKEIFFNLDSGENKSHNRIIDFGKISGKTIVEDYKFRFEPILNSEKEAVGMLSFAISSVPLANTVKAYKSRTKEMIANVTKVFIIVAVIIFLLSTIYLYLYAGQIVNPIQKILNIVEKVAKGDLNCGVEIENNDEMGDLARGVNNMIINLKFMAGVKDDFIATTSHELKTPLHGIIGISESLYDGTLGEINANQKNNLDMVIKSGNRLLELINDILDMSKLKDLTGEELVKKSIDISSIVDRVNALLWPLIKEKGLRFENSIEKERYYILADENRVVQVLYNLIGNSIKFTDDGLINTSVEDLGDYIKIEISDTGRGVSKEKQEEIFKAFKQGDNSIDREHSGSGLGLSISKQIVEMHGGTIQVESEVNKGAKFSFTMPKTNASEKESVELVFPDFENQIAKIKTEINTIGKEEEEKNVDVGDRSEYKILIADDEPVNRAVLENYLKGKYKTVSARNGKEVLEMLDKERFDLLLLDVMMPGMSGYEVCKEIRKEKSIFELPVLMLTAKTQNKDILEGFASGANDYLTKPFDKQELFARINTLIGLKRAVESSLNSARKYKNERRQRIMAEDIKNLTRELASTLDVKIVIEILITTIKEDLGFEKAMAFLIKDQDSRLIYNRGFEGYTKDVELSNFVEKVKESENIVESINNIIGVKVKYRGKLKGYLVLERKTIYNEDELEVLTTFAEQAGISVENANLFAEVSNKTLELKNTVENMKSIERLAMMLYNEKNMNRAVYYTLLLLVSKVNLGYKEGMYLEYIKQENRLVARDYFYNVSRYSDKHEMLMEIERNEGISSNLEFDLDYKNIMSDVIKNGKISFNNSNENMGEGMEEFSKMMFRNFTLVPIVNNEESYGIIALESQDKESKVSEYESEILSIFTSNLAIYIENRMLEKANIKNEQTTTILNLAKAIVHELRTPLVSIKGFASILKNKYKEDMKIQNYTDVIIKDADRVDDMATDLLDYAGRGDIVYKFEYFDLVSLIKEVVDKNEMEIKINQIEIKYDVLDKIDIRGDKKYLKKVFLNLIKNSIESIKGHDDAIFISVKKDALDVIVVIEDKGVGIEKDKLALIFEPLYSSKVQGTGLGLPIVRETINRHKGSIILNSNVGEGTMIKIRLPIKK